MVHFNIVISTAQFQFLVDLLKSIHPGLYLIPYYDSSQIWKEKYLIYLRFKIIKQKNATFLSS